MKSQIRHCPFPLLHGIKVTPSSGLFSHSCRNRRCQGYTFFNAKHKHLKRLLLCLCCSLHACRRMFRQYFVIFEFNLYKLNLCLLFLSNLPTSKQTDFCLCWQGGQVYPRRMAPYPSPAMHMTQKRQSGYPTPGPSPTMQPGFSPQPSPQVL